jgi:hypothetical protein
MVTPPRAGRLNPGKIVEVGRDVHGGLGGVEAISP